jgi:hypothetical protein
VRCCILLLESLASLPVSSRQWTTIVLHVCICSGFTAFSADSRHARSLQSLMTFLESSLIWHQIRLVFPQLASPPNVLLPAHNENSCSIRFYVLVNCCRVWDGRNSELLIWIYNTCRIGILYVPGTKTRDVTMTLLMRMTMIARLQTSGQVCATHIA